MSKLRENQESGEHQINDNSRQHLPVMILLGLTMILRRARWLGRDRRSLWPVAIFAGTAGNGIETAESGNDQKYRHS